jgi:hypothetical protein
MSHLIVVELTRKKQSKFILNNRVAACQRKAPFHWQMEALNTVSYAIGISKLTASAGSLHCLRTSCFSLAVLTIFKERHDLSQMAQRSHSTLAMPSLRNVVFLQQVNFLKREAAKLIETLSLWMCIVDETL